MSKKLFLSVLFLLLYSFAYAQADCVISFKYKATIKSTSVKITAIGLPTTAFLLEYIDQNDEMAFAWVKAKNNIDQVLSSHMSSDFCADWDFIIEQVFKNPKAGYRIRIFYKSAKNKQSIREVTIPLDSIKFSLGTKKDKAGIIVDLGEIKI